jgi:hypothetical protein
MATVRWLNTNTGETKWGEEDLYRQGEDSWAPVCRIKMPDGSIRENTLDSFYSWIDKNFAMVRIDSTKSVGIVSMTGVTLDINQRALFLDVLSRYEYLMAEPTFPVMSVFYQPSITEWPDRKLWVEAKKTDEDTTDETNGGGQEGNAPKPGKPRMNPFKKPGKPTGPPMPGPSMPKPSDIPPPFPGPEPFR